MRSSNPVFTRRGFSRDGGYAGFNAGQPQTGNPYAGSPTNPYAQPGNPYAQPQVGPHGGAVPPAAPPRAGVMTIDSVVSRTALTLGTVVAFAAVAWVTDMPLALGFVFALVALGLGLWQSFKREASPALILSYAVAEGLFLGTISSAINAVAPGAAMQAVIGTMAVFAGVLFMYKQRIIRVNARFTKFVLAAAVGFILLSLVNLVVAMIGGGNGLGLRDGGLGILFGIAGVLLGACFLALDFKMVEDGIAYGAPEKESWMAAFGLTLTLVWIYLEFLRLVAILQGE
ncbi:MULTISPECIES: Bax inhibitor-1/YccA family protein [unclassified Streptomyces]|uniref:Bax inhibitor-1/YccA family protein n=1 Tax=Streptomyces johnsoniae TaxID=3075532 RepID=A0ABU2RY25_9ACTN|nr:MULTISPECIES: Bax inhibitor-1/YccA family protein [unclassified Streptomyces]MDT0441668.1 Bax inhibitor-1/YccA family protein [Streptomyces sp. DSM 41886]ONK13822.1 putative membrane protein [Streptomyces sp. MP131-18]